MDATVPVGACVADRTDEPRFRHRVSSPALRFLPVLLTFAAAARLDAATPSFTAPFVAYGTDPVPVAVEGADLNGDGWVDLVSANVRRSTISVLLGPARSRPATVTTSFGPRPGDRRPRRRAVPDIVAACVRSVVTILHGAGDGGFDDHVDVETGFEPKGIGSTTQRRPHADMMTLSSAYNNPPGSFTLRLGNGDAAHSERAPTSRLAASRPVIASPTWMRTAAPISSLRTRRRTGDDPVRHRRRRLRSTRAELRGRQPACASAIGIATDVRMCRYHDRLELGTWFGASRCSQRPGGGLVPAGDLFALTFLVDLDSGDVDGDGDLDLIAQGLQASVYPGRGDGHFDPPHPYEVGALPADLFVGDLDADGKPDLAVAAMDSQTLSVLLGHGDGTFGINPIPTALSPQSVLLEDLDGDGDLDLAAACQTNGIVAVHTGNGDGTFGLRRDLQVSTKLASVAAGDLNGDGRADLAAVSFLERVGGTLSVMLANPAGGWFPHVDRPLAGPATCVVLGDWNRDGKLDAAASEWTTAYPNESHVEVLFGAGDGSFASDTLQAVGPLPMALTAGDADGDGDLDLVASYRRGRRPSSAA
jgi:hypothetical protein